MTFHTHTKSALMSKLPVQFQTYFLLIRIIFLQLLLCVGSFFGETEENKKEWDSYMNGETLAPIVTYILGPNDPEEMKHFDSSFLEDGKELCENITFLGNELKQIDRLRNGMGQLE